MTTLKKYIYVSLFISLFACVSVPKKMLIPQLETTKQVEEFVRNYKFEDPFLKDLMQSFSLVSISDYYGIKELDTILKEKKLNVMWGKADFDGNGLTDLFVWGTPVTGAHNLMVFFAHNNRTTSYTFIKGRYINYYATRVIQLVPELMHSVPNGLLLHHYEDWKLLKTDTLMYRYGGFMRHQESEKKCSVVSVEFENDVDPEFKLVVDKNGKARLNALSGNFKYQYSRYSGEWLDRSFFHRYDSTRLKKYFPKEEFRDGRYERNLTDIERDNLFGTLDYVDWSNIKAQYRTGWSEVDTSTLTVYFSDGTSKKVKDEDLMGTYNLARIYDFLFKIKHYNKWNKQK